MLIFSPLLLLPFLCELHGKEEESEQEKEGFANWENIVRHQTNFLSDLFVHLKSIKLRTLSPYCTNG